MRHTKAKIIDTAKLLFSPPDEGLEIQSRKAVVGYNQMLESTPERPLSENTEGQCLECFKSAETFRIVMPEFYPAGFFRQPRGSIFEIRSSRSDGVNQIPENLLVLTDVIQHFAGELSEFLVRVCSSQNVQQFRREGGTSEMIMEVNLQWFGHLNTSEGRFSVVN
ncbi:MAG TPA: hypothetical protein VG297_04025 [Bryobacteraceae bacterium]|nr:hypothetical protein [Bryobacteraceae bacterium]